VISFLQIGAGVRFNVEARCVNASQPVTLHARLETVNEVLFDLDKPETLQLRSDGYAEKSSVVFPVPGQGLFQLEGAEARMSVTLTDADGTSVTEQLRLTLTLDGLDDLPETEEVSQPDNRSPVLGEVRQRREW
jgi:hypothetical protein